VAGVPFPRAEVAHYGRFGLYGPGCEYRDGLGEWRDLCEVTLYRSSTWNCLGKVTERLEHPAKPWLQIIAAETGEQLGRQADERLRSRDDLTYRVPEGVGRA
jgi:hypothetical protein